MAPNISDDAIVASAREPRTPPTMEITQATIRFAIPPCPMISPARMKNGMATSG